MLAYLIHQFEEQGVDAEGATYAFAAPCAGTSASLTSRPAPFPSRSSQPSKSPSYGCSARRRRCSRYRLGWRAVIGTIAAGIVFHAIMIGSLSVFLAGHIGVFTLDAIQVIKPVLTSSSWRGWDASGQFRPPALAPAMRRPPSAQSWAGLVAKTLEGKAVVELLAGRDARKSVSSSQARLGRRKRAALGRQALSLAVASASEMFRRLPAQTSRTSGSASRACSRHPKLSGQTAPAAPTLTES